MKKGISYFYHILMIVAAPFLLVFLFGLILSVYNLVSGSANQKFVVFLFFLFLLAFLILSFYWVVRRAEKQSEKARAEWIAGVSHDIRTPLSILLGYSGEWKEDEALPEKRRNEAAQMAAACRTVSSLVADLNLTMKLDYAMQPLRKETVPLLPLLRETVAELLNSGAVRTVTLEETKLPPDLTLFADRMLLKRAFTNLIGNAERHGIAGNEITVALTEETRVVCLTVKNRIALAVDPNEFTGTGLTLVRQIAKAHRGKLTLSTGETPDGPVLSAELLLPKNSKRPVIRRSRRARQ